MFPRRYFAGRFFAPRYWPQSAGGAPAPAGRLARLATPIASVGRLLTR